MAAPTGIHHGGDVRPDVSRGMGGKPGGGGVRMACTPSAGGGGDAGVASLLTGLLEDGCGSAQVGTWPCCPARHGGEPAGAPPVAGLLLRSGVSSGGGGGGGWAASVTTGVLPEPTTGSAGGGLKAHHGPCGGGERIPLAPPAAPSAGGGGGGSDAVLSMGVDEVCGMEGGGGGGSRSHHGDAVPASVLGLGLGALHGGGASCCAGCTEEGVPCHHQGGDAPSCCCRARP